MTKSLMLWSLSVLLAGSVAFAQEMPRFTGKVGAGFTTPTDTAGDRLDRGWNLGAGAGVNFSPHFTLMGDFQYNHFGVNAGTLNALGFPDGDASLWSLTLDPVIHTHPRGPVDVYFTGGGGLYHWHQQFTQPTTETVTAFDPYFGFFYQAAVPVNQVLSSYSMNKFGWNGGGGVEFGTPWSAKIFAEVRYHRMLLGNDRHADFVPITFGVRW